MKQMQYCFYNSKKYKLIMENKKNVVLKENNGLFRLQIALQENEILEYFMQMNEDEFMYAVSVEENKIKKSMQCMHLKIKNDGIEILHFAKFYDTQNYKMLLSPSNEIIIHTFTNRIFIYNAKLRKSFVLNHPNINYCRAKIDDQEREYPLIKIKLGIQAKDFIDEEENVKDIIEFYINGCTVESTNIYSHLQKRQIPIIESEDVPLSSRITSTIEQEIIKYLKILNRRKEIEQLEQDYIIRLQLLQNLNEKK